jgi:hypothetical protein
VVDYDKQGRPSLRSRALVKRSAKAKRPGAGE